MSRALFVSLVSALTLCTLTAACGGKLNDPPATMGDTGAPTDGGTTGDGGSGGGSDTPLPDGKTCAQMGDAICGAEAKACCGTLNLAYDEAACRTSVNYWCNFQVDAANAGSTTYDPTQLAACVKGWRESFAVCNISWIDWGKKSLPCAQLFNGTKAPGQSCTSEVECQAEPGFIAYCDTRETMATSDDRCRQYGFVAEGKPCNYTGTTIRYCDVGLYCDYGVSPAVCKKSRAAGESCPGGQDPSCGYDHVCVGGKCALGKPGGSDCTDATECGSWACEGGKCDSTTFPLATSETCNGTDTMPATDAGMAAD